MIKRLVINGTVSPLPKIQTPKPEHQPAPFDWFAFVLNHLGYRGEGR